MSNRNNNNRVEYSLEKKMNQSALDYQLNSNFSENNDSHKMSELGSVPRLFMSNLSHNSVDIESKLRNIRSTNLEGEDFNPKLKSKALSSKSFFDNNLRNQVYLPGQFRHYSNERPGFFNL